MNGRGYFPLLARLCLHSRLRSLLLRFAAPRLPISRAIWIAHRALHRVALQSAAFCNKVFHRDAARRSDLLGTFETKPAHRLFALVLLVRILNSFVEIGAQGGRYCEAPRAFPCEASALARRFHENRKLALHLILHFSFHASAFRCPLLSLAVTRPE